MRVGVIGGAGKIGRMRIQTIRENPRTELAAVMDLDETAAKKVAGDAPVFTDSAAFFDSDMDAVVISTPAHVREPLVMEAIGRGLHILAEKPLTHKLESSRKIYEAAKAAGIAFGAGFNMRYYPAFAHVRDVMDSGEIGDIDHVRIYGGHEGLPKFAFDWEYKSEISGGGALWDVGIHMTDMARFMLGEIISIYGVTSERVWKEPGSEDNAMAIFQSPEGVSAIYQATWTDWNGYKSAVEVYGSKGMVRGTYAPMETLTITMDEPGGIPKRVLNKFRNIQVAEKLKSWKVTALASFAAELDDFVSLTEGKSGLRIADAAAGLRAVEIASRLGDSGRSGTAIALEDLREDRT